MVAFRHVLSAVTSVAWHIVIANGEECSSTTFPACLPPVDILRTDSVSDWPSQDDVELFAEQLTGTVAEPGSYDYRLYSYNARTNTPRPSFVVFPESTEDVTHALAFAQLYGMRVSVSSTGHHQDVRNLVDNGLHIDMSRFTSVEVDVANKLAKVGTGAYFGIIVAAIAEASDDTLVVASGTDASVGPYGWTVGGGYGRLTRTYVHNIAP